MLDPYAPHRPPPPPPRVVVTTRAAPARADLAPTNLGEKLRPYPEGLAFGELHRLLDCDVEVARSLLERALRRREVYRTGSRASLRYHAR
jgi:hypothetical protein